MRFHVLPYTLARSFVPTERTLAIRIFDPDADRSEDNNAKQKLTTSPFWVAELEYTFVDFDPLRYSGFQLSFVTDMLKEYQDKNWLITPVVAAQIINSFARYKDRINAVMIHCNAGMSRSPTVALFLCRHFNITPEWVGTRDYYMKNCVFDMLEGRPAPNSMVWDMLEGAKT